MKQVKVVHTDFDDNEEVLFIYFDDAASSTHFKHKSENNDAK